MSCDVGEVAESLENELCYVYNYELGSFSNLSVTSPTSQLILQPFRRFTYIMARSPTLLFLHLRPSSISNTYFASLTSQLILQPFCHFTYIIAHSSTLPSLHLRHRHITYVTWRAAHPFKRKKTLVTTKYQMVTYYVNFEFIP